jgi:MFS family permease
MSIGPATASHVSERTAAAPPRASVPLLICLGATQFGFGLHGVVYTAFAGYFLRAKFGLSVPEAAQLVGLGLLLFGLLQFAIGFVADLGIRLYGRKTMLVRVAVTYTCSWLLFSIISVPLLAAVAAGVGGLAGAGAPIVLSYLSDHTERRRSGLVSGLQDVTMVFGQVAALGIGWLLVSRGRSQALVLAVSALWAATAALLAWLLPADAIARAPEIDTRGVLRLRLRESTAALWLMLAHPATRRLKAVIAVAAAGPVLASTYLPLLLIGVVADPARSAGYLAAASAAGYVLAMLLTPALGHWSDRRGNKPTLLLVVCATLAVALALVGVSSRALVVAGVVVLVSIGGRWLNMLQRAIQLELATAEQRTTFFMANQLPFFAGLPAGLLLSMVVVQVTGSIVNALLVVSLLFAGGAALWGDQLWRQRRVVPAGTPAVALAEAAP